MVYRRYLAVLGAGSALACGPSYTIPATLPSDAVPLHQTPVAVSIEFFMWPSYMRNITISLQCLKQLDAVYGRKTPVRIGGTTHDRATYDPDFDGYVSYQVDDPLDAPMKLLYGPRYFDLINELGAPTTIGFNRAQNSRSNTFEAIVELKQKSVKYVDAIELGNEPDLYLEFWNYPVAEAPWNATQEGNNAADWAEAFKAVWGSPLPILAAGGYAIPFPYRQGWPNLPYLISEAYNQSVKAATKEYNGHLYAFSNASANGLAIEMSHTRTVQDVALLPIKNALDDGKPYILGETGFHGEEFEMDAQFGGAIQIVDKTLRALSAGVSRLYYHQGTINQASFNWWRSDKVNTPFYGGYTAALSVADGHHIKESDDGTDQYAQYVIYKDGKPFKVVLVNTDFYLGTGTRSRTRFNLSGLATENVTAIRLTAPSSLSIASLEQSDARLEPTIGGRYFEHDDCSLKGESVIEKFDVEGGQLSVDVNASEVVIVYLE